jgi:hypothetical protein
MTASVRVATEGACNAACPTIDGDRSWRALHRERLESAISSRP